MRPGIWPEMGAVRARDLRFAGPWCQAIVGLGAGSDEAFSGANPTLHGVVFDILIPAPRKPARGKQGRGNYAPCWRALEAWDWSARMRSASVPPPSDGPTGAGAPLPAMSLAGLAGVLGAA